MASKILNRAALKAAVEEVCSDNEESFDELSLKVEEMHLRVYGVRNSKEQHSGLGDGFRYCTLGSPLFDKAGMIVEEVSFADLAAHVFFTETGEPIPKRVTCKTPFIGECDDVAYYLLFNGVLGDKRPNGGNVLTGPVLESLPQHDGPRIIYGEGCRLGAARLKREGIVFKQVPYEIKVS